MGESSIYKDQLVQELLDQLPQPKQEKCNWSMYIPISKKFEDKGRHIIAGYASVEVIDSQEELIPISTLKEAWKQFKANKDFYFGSLMHSNVPVIKVLDTYETESGEVLKSGVDQNGLFIVSEVRYDIEKGKQTWELIKLNKLTGYSIGGEALASTRVCEDSKKCFTRIDKMELHEIAVVDKPANAPSIFKIIKREREVTEFIVKDATIDEIKWKIKEVISRREELNRKMSPLPWESILTEKDKSNAESEIVTIDKQLTEYKGILGTKLAEQTLLAKSQVEYGYSVEEIKIKINEIITRRKKLNDKSSPLPWEKKLTDLEKENLTFEIGTIDKELEKYRSILGVKLADQELVSKVETKIERVDINKVLKGLVDPSIKKFDIALRRMIGKPFAGYSSFEDCERQNPQAKDPAAYCATIQDQTEKMDKAEEGCKCNIIECPVDDTIHKASWNKMDEALSLFLKRE